MLILVKVGTLVKVRTLLLKGHSRSNRRAAIHALAAFAVLSAFLIARNVPPRFPKAPAHYSSISAVSGHHQRPHFDSDGSQWIAPVRSFQPFPPTAIATSLPSASQLFSTLETKGFHYDRPPPAA